MAEHPGLAVSRTGDYTARPGWFWRNELPTWGLAALIYGCWFALAWFHAAILWFAIQVAGMPWWQYLLFFVHGGMMPGMLWPFLEHRWGERPFERVASVESVFPMGLPWLWNNPRVVHHPHPTMPWYDIPGCDKTNRERLMELNGQYVHAGYRELIPSCGKLNPSWPPTVLSRLPQRRPRPRFHEGRLEGSCRRRRCIFINL